MTSSTLLTPRQAAEKLGISYPALKHWILAGRIQTIKTPGGHHRIPMSALQEFLPMGSAHLGASRISGRNQLAGTIVEVKVDGLLAKVVIAIGDQRITAIITADEVRELESEARRTSHCTHQGDRSDGWKTVRTGIQRLGTTDQE